MRKKTIASLLVGAIILGLLLPVTCDAGFLFHATKKAVARRIFKKGFSISKMSKNTRFRQGPYLSSNRKTALKEAPEADSVIRYQGSKYLNKNIIKLEKPTPEKIRQVTKVKDLRGSVKNGVIGPKLGGRLGKAASEKGKVIRYHSAKDPKGTNMFIPAKTYKQHPEIIKPLSTTNYTSH